MSEIKTLEEVIAKGKVEGMLPEGVTTGNLVMYLLDIVFKQQTILWNKLAEVGVKIGEVGKSIEEDTNELKVMVGELRNGR
jgi:hypothetical protein